MESKKKSSTFIIILLLLSIILNIVFYSSLMSIKVKTRLCIKLHNGTNIISAYVPPSHFRFFFTESSEPGQAQDSKYKENAKYIDKCLIEYNGKIIFTNNYDTNELVGFCDIPNWTHVKMYITITNMPYNKELYINLSKPL